MRRVEAALKMASARIAPGQRVWVADSVAPGGRVYGRIVSVDRPGYLSEGTGFVVQLDEANRVVACAASTRGVAWDFAAEA